MIDVSGGSDGDRRLRVDRSAAVRAACALNAQLSLELKTTRITDLGELDPRTLGFDAFYVRPR